MGVRTIENISKTLTFSIDKYTLEEVNEQQLMILEMWIVSEGNNAHDMPIPRDAIINAASSLIGKPVLYKYSDSDKDFEAHEMDEISCGVLALNKLDYSFKEDEEGKLWLVCRAYIWKFYYPEVVDVFIRDKEKAISMEILIVDSVVDENNETQIINAFSFLGVTLLGDKYNPAIRNANVTVEKFSELVDETKKLLNKETIQTYEKKEVEKVAEKFNKTEFAQSYNYTVLEMLQSFQNQLTQTYTCTDYGDEFECKRYSCRDFCKNYVYVSDYEMGQIKAMPYSKDLKIDFEGAKACRYTYVVPEGGNPEMPEDENMVVELVFTKDEYIENAKTFSDKNKELKKQIETFSNNETNLKTEIQKLKDSNSELITFKENILKQEREQNIKFAIDSVSDVLNKDQVKEWTEKAKDYDNSDSFKNAIQAFAFTQTKSNKEPDKNNMRIQIPNNSEPEKKGLWN